MKELDAFHVPLYRLHHHDLAGEAWPAVAVSADEMTTACQASRPLHSKAVRLREAEVRPEIATLCAKSDTLKAAARNDRKATATAAEAVHAQYRKVEGSCGSAGAAGRRRPLSRSAGCRQTGGRDPIASSHLDRLVFGPAFGRGLELDAALRGCTSGLPLLRRRAIRGHRGLDERLERARVDLLPFVHVDRLRALPPSWN